MCQIKQNIAHAQECRDSTADLDMMAATVVSDLSQGGDVVTLKAVHELKDKTTLF